MPSLRTTLLLNAASCLAFGGWGLAQPAIIARLLGAASPDIILALGALLVVNGLHLLIAARRREIRSWEVLWFSAGDLAWWCGSMLVLALGDIVTTTYGIALTAVIAVGVATMGVVQLWHLGVRLSGATHREHLQGIARSWLALPRWVKVWLIVLNLAFLVALLLSGPDATRIILVSYAASGPLLFGLMAYQGGLTRLLGSAHLVAWTPLLVWLASMLVTPQTPASATPRIYLAILTGIVAICLAFDVADGIRWLRGERQPIGRQAPPLGADQASASRAA